MEEKNKRKSIVYLVIGIVTLIALIAGATYAYFQAVTGNNAIANLNTTTGTTDNLTFNLKDKDVANTDHKIIDENNSTETLENTEIKITANSTNFAENGNSIGDGVIGTINLKANNGNYIASKTYNVYLQIETNELKYSSYTQEGLEKPKVFKTEEEKEKETLEGYTGVPELILLVKGPDGKFNEISDLPKATMKSENDGYDITEKSGIITIAENVEIKTTGESLKEVTDTWEIEVILKNLETDQNLNTGKKLTGKVIISPDKMGSSSTGGESNVLSTLLANSNDEYVQTLYHHNSELENGANDDSYRFSGGNDIYTISPEHPEIKEVMGDLIKFSCEGETISFIDDNDISAAFDNYTGDFNNEITEENACIQIINDWVNMDDSVYYYNYKDNEYFYLTNNNSVHYDIKIYNQGCDYNEEGGYNEYCYNGSRNWKEAYSQALEQAAKEGYLKKYGVNNYVCFGSNAEKCPEENLYRIIGLFPTDEKHTTYEMKIIKATPATSIQLGGEGLGATSHSDKYYYWNKSQNSSGDGTNNWKTSNLNTENLNGYYLNKYLQNIDDGKWYKMISDHKWITAGNTYNNVLDQYVKTAYENEILHPNVGTEVPNAATEVEAKVGLMYVSDYGYAAYKEAWDTKSLYEYADSTITFNNWMYMNNDTDEWTITRSAVSSSSAFYVNFDGHVGSGGVGNVDAVRPVLYLKSSVKITSGDGTSGSPYKLSM